MPGEQDLVDRLAALAGSTAAGAIEFFARPGRGPSSRADFYGSAADSGLLDLFQRDQRASAGDILRINQENMEEASRRGPRRRPATSLAGFAIGVGRGRGCSLALAGWQLLRAVLRPIQELTDAATAIGAGQLHRTVPLSSAATNSADSPPRSTP